MKGLPPASCLLAPGRRSGRAASILSEDFAADDDGLAAGLLAWSAASGPILHNLGISTTPMPAAALLPIRALGRLAAIRRRLPIAVLS